MKYSYHCSNCGFTFMSDNKTDVAIARSAHKRISVIGLLRKDYVKYCPLVPVGDGTSARQSLISSILESQP